MTITGTLWSLLFSKPLPRKEPKPSSKTDPAVRAYVFQAQVWPMDVHWLTDKFQPGAETCEETANSAK